jgi:hypothetical protein
MTTKTLIVSSATAALIAVTSIAVTLAVPVPQRERAAAAAAAPAADADDDADGRDEMIPSTHRPGVELAFARESYAPGEVARLHVFGSARNVFLDVVHAGLEHAAIVANDVLDGVPVTAPRRLASVHRGQTIPVRLGANWPSGLYFARLTGPHELAGYATFVLRPRRLGEHRVAVVLPTQTWQAYNFRDDDHDGVGDTWYSGGGRTHARLFRPIYNRGVPPHYKYYDQPFLRWLESTKRPVDVLADGDLLSVRDGRALARAYDLVVFEGHHEYVTTHEYDVVTGYRDNGGNLMFLSANNFYWKITRSGDLMTRVARWRDIGRPESSLIGVQFYRNDMGEHRGPWRVVSTAAAPWLFEGTDLHAGSTLGSGGIEADTTTPASPAGTRVIAEIPNLYGDGIDAKMSYYQTPVGAKVFAAGAFTIAGEAQWPPVAKVLDNLWNYLSRP